MTAQHDTDDRSAALAIPVAGTRDAQPGGRLKGDAGFAAQVLGAGGQRRGLRGGPPAMDAARSVYLQTEWSGDADRRFPPGLLTRREV